MAELPRARAAATEYRWHTLVCGGCGAATATAWPAGMPAGGFGPRVAATAAYLTGRCGASHREAREILGAVCGLAVGLGSIAALERQVSAALAAPVAEAHAYVRERPVANADETGWREQGRRCWLRVTVFLMRPSRGSRSARELLGADYAGVVGSDRWGGYNWVATGRRQVCWSRLARDFTAVQERGGASRALGTAYLDVADRLFALWYRVHEGTTDRAAFATLAAPLQAELHALLTTGRTIAHAKTRHLCETLLKTEPALWTFVAAGGVEPTNNSAERALRRAVLWRRRCFGTQSTAGNRFVGRILTALATLRPQDRDVLDYLTDATQAQMGGTPTPSLLPLPARADDASPAPPTSPTRTASTRASCPRAQTTPHRRPPRVA